jgi:hypothetical protein
VAPPQDDTLEAVNVDDLNKPAYAPPDTSQPSYYDTDYANFPVGHPMRTEYERQRQESMSLAQKMFQLYQSLRGRR